MFWRSKDPEKEESAAPADEVRDHLAPVRIFTAESTVDGWIEIGGQRLSDVLNVEELLSVSRVRTAPTETQWFVLERDEMLLVVPPPYTSDRIVRLHRVKRRILAVSGHYVVRGVVHMMAGIALDPFLARSRQHFLPLTETWITSTERLEVDEQHPALLLNVRSTGHGLKLEVLE